VRGEADATPDEKLKIKNQKLKIKSLDSEYLIMRLRSLCLTLRTKIPLTLPSPQGERAG
jgi:hypothetical protein